MQRSNECKENIEHVDSGIEVRSNENTREKLQNEIVRLKNVIKMNNEVNETESRILCIMAV